MGSSDWLLAASDLDFPGVYWVLIDGFQPKLFVQALSPTFLPVLGWDGLQTDETSFADLVDRGWIEQD